MALFFLGGMVEFSNKIYQKYAMIEYKEVFLFMVFVSAFHNKSGISDWRKNQD